MLATLTTSSRAPFSRRRLARTAVRSLAAFALVTCCVAAARADAVRVGVAISLKEAFTDIAAGYEKASGDKVEFVFGSSGQIMAQIKGGAGIDLFVSAATKQVDDLAKEGLVEPGSVRTVASNRLVLIVPSDAKAAPADFHGLADHGGRVAVGEPRTVPAGQYAEQAFASLQLSDKLRGRLVYGTNVRQVLAYVERGEVAAGVVYATDAIQSGGKVRVVATADPRTHEPIVYPAVLVSTTKRRAAAARFLEHLGSAGARQVLERRGFALPAAAATASDGGADRAGDARNGKP